jgi:hypothetical protein
MTRTVIMREIATLFPKVSSERIRFELPGLQTTPLTGSLLLPFESGINPHVPGIAEQNLAWALDQRLILPSERKLIDSVRRCQFEQLSALAHRDCSRKALELVANSQTAIFVLDDMLDSETSIIGGDVELATHVADYLSATVAAEPTPSLRIDVPRRDRIVAVGRAFHNVALRLLEYTDREGLRHYVEGMRSYLLGCVMESQRRRDRVGDLSEYTAVRLRCSAVYPCLDTGAIVEGFTVPREIWHDPAFRMMRMVTNLCVSFVNDLFSYAKESEAGEFSNIVTVYRMAHGMNLEQAFAASIEMNDSIVREYLDAKAELERRYRLDEGTRGYIKLMEHWMRGNFDWYHQQRTDRYIEHLTTAIPA